MQLDEGKLSPGVVNAMTRQKSHDTCVDCGFPMPVYPGRYPSSCPVCGRSRMTLPEPQKPEQDDDPEA